jgi:NAD(P)H-quinone oxidoreductase subunit 5
VPRYLTLAQWALFALLTPAALLRAGAEPMILGPFRLDGLTLFLGAAVTLVSAVVHLFSTRFMAGEARYEAFFARLSALTAVVLLLLAADALPLFAALWLAMGWLLADLIGHVRGWRQAEAAAALARGWFLRGTAALVAGFVVLGLATGSASVSGVAAGAAGAPPGFVALGCALLALAAAIQSGLFPFHRWLFSSMTAPTPVSAFMHAGLVNAGGILVARFAPAFEVSPVVLGLVFLAGAGSAAFGALAALVQTDVKRGLAASTTAQMGFMLLQAGLGLHAAAMAHLVLHGLYKASLFLGAGSGLAAGHAARCGSPDGWRPDRRRLRRRGRRPAQGFAIASASSMTAPGALLSLFAAAAAGAGDAPAARLGAGRGACGCSASLACSTAASCGGSRAILSGVPGLAAAQPLGALHVLVALGFAALWLAIQAGLHRRPARPLCPAGRPLAARRPRHRRPEGRPPCLSSPASPPRSRSRPRTSPPLGRCAASSPPTPSPASRSGLRGGGAGRRRAVRRPCPARRRAAEGRARPTGRSTATSRRDREAPRQARAARPAALDVPPVAWGDARALGREPGDDPLAGRLPRRGPGCLAHAGPRARLLARFPRPRAA